MRKKSNDCEPPSAASVQNELVPIGTANLSTSLPVNARRFLPFTFFYLSNTGVGRFVLIKALVRCIYLVLAAYNNN